MSALAAAMRQQSGSKQTAGNGRTNAHGVEMQSSISLVKQTIM
jgi:hypothetical protein